MEESKDVGTILREARLAKGLSIADVEKKICIRGSYLEAIEDGDFDKTPEEVFVKGMIRNYGNFLGLDGLELVNIYKASKTGSSAENVRSVGIREVDKVKMNIQFKDKRDVGSGTGRFEFSAKQFFTGIFACVLIAAIYFLMPAITDYLARSGGNADRVSEHAKQEAAVAEAQKEELPQTEAEAVSEAAPEAEPQQEAAAVAEGNVTIEIEASGNCWLEANGDGEELYSGMLRAGDRKTYEAKDKLIVKYGNVGAVSVKVNGVPEDLQGEQGVSIKTYAAGQERQ